MALLIARRPEAVVAAEFTWEEAGAFYVPTYFLDPLAQVAETWGGTFQVVPRLGYLMLRAIPVYWAPVAENLLALAALLALAGFVASRRMEAVVPDRRVRLALAAALLVLPAQHEVMGALMNSQWYGGLWLMLLPIASVPATTVGQWLERGMVALLAVTGPFSILLAPLYVWRLWRSRSRHDLWLVAIVAAGGLIQLAAILATGRAEIVEERPIELALTTFWLHAAIVPILGERLGTALGSAGIPGAILFVGGAALIGALAVTAWRSLPAMAWPFVAGALVVGLSGVAIHGGANVWPPGSYERYFLAAAALASAIIIAGLVRRGRLAALLAVLLGAGVLTDFRLEPHPAQGWDRSYGCIGSADPCVVPIWPPEYEVRWPGSGGRYDIPEHVDP
jgi:hypothetical protein